jgi:hypothetical protein
MFLAKVFDFLKGLITPTVSTVTAQPVAVASPTPGATATAVQTTTVETPAEIADADLEAAITIVNNIKAALASPLAVLITDLIPISIVGTIREDLVTELPVLAASLANIKIGIDTADLSAQFNDVLSQIRFSTNIDLNAFEHNLAAKLLSKISGTTWSVAVMSVEYYFVNVFKSALNAVKSVFEPAVNTAAPAPAIEASAPAAPAVVAEAPAAQVTE